MKISGDCRVRIHINRPDSPRSPVKTHKDQLIATRASNGPVINFHFCIFQYKIMFLMSFDPCSTMEKCISGRGTEGDRKQFRRTRPQFQIKARHILLHIHFYRRGIFIGTATILSDLRFIACSPEMMSGICLVSRCHNDATSPKCSDIIHIFTQWTFSGMAPIVRTHSQTDDQRLLQFPCHGFQIRNACHHIIFLIDSNSIGNIIKIPQILFCRF